jgi:photosystem II stability/assembly factor-like uncharacterized protein
MSVKTRHVLQYSFASVMLLFISDAFAQKLSQNIVEHFQYRSIGPTKQGGRVTDIAVSQRNKKMFFIATASGGIWKTVNNGTTFHPVFDKQSTSVIGDVEVAPSDDTIVWAGTGESSLRNSTNSGEGVFRSQDGGKTWEFKGLKESHHIGRIIIHPANPDIVYVAAQGHLYTENPERGVYKTTDGGRNWTKSLEVTVNGRHIGAADIVMDPENPDILYASSYDRLRKPWTFTTAGPGSRIYKTVDGGTTWKKLTRGLPDGMLGRIGLDIYLRNSDILYATIDNANSPGISTEERYEELRAGRRPAVPTIGHQVYRSDDRGESWRLVSAQGESVGGRSNYYGQIRIDPNDENHLYVLSVSVRESFDGGQSWNNAYEFKDDHHALWIDPDDSDHILLGNDHGIGITYDGGETFRHPDELPLAQLYAIGVDMDYPYNVYGGTQDNGSWKGPSTKKGMSPIRFEDWEHIGGGDGFYHQVDPGEGQWIYSESQFGGIQRIDRKTGRRKGIRYRNGQGIRFNWNAPILISPHDNDVIYHGANKLLKSDFRGENWYEISPDLTTNDPMKINGVGAVRYCTITTVDESSVQPGVIWVGTDDGNVQLTLDGGSTWTKMNDNITENPGYWISRVIASHHDAGTAYVTYTGFYHNDPKPYVYKTADFGKSWRSIAYDLPDEPVNVIREDRKNRNLLFVGTDKAVHVSIDGGEHWSRMQNNMPAQPVHDLVIHPRESDLVVGTHGRGFFLTDISPLQEITPGLLEKDVHLFNMEPQIQWVIPSRKVVSSQNFSGPNEPYGIEINYYLKNNVPDGVQVTVYDGSVPIRELQGTGSAGLNTVLWDMRKVRERTDAEIAERQPQLESEALEEPWFHVYDEVDYHDIGGNNLDERFFTQPVKTDEYIVKLTIGDTELTGIAHYIPDYWYDKQY